MILSAKEATKLTHESEYYKNRKVVDEIEKQIYESIEDQQYFTVYNNSYLNTSVKKFLEDLGYEVHKQMINPNICREDNYYYIIRWGG